MATTPARVTVAGMARLYLAPVGTTFPTNARDAISTSWTEVGLFTPDSLKFTTEPDFEDVEAHQSAYPVRTIQTGDSATVEVDLLEWSSANFIYVYGGGSITPIALTGPTATHYKFSPPAIGGRAEVAVLAEITDGTKVYRLAIPRAQQQEGAELELNRTSAAILPLRLKVLGGDIGDPWYVLTTDSAFSDTPAAPTISGVTPATGGAAGGTQVMISGTNFVSGATVTFGGTTATSVIVASPTAIVSITPAHAAGAVAVAVTTAGGTASSAGAFTYS
jgi:hypothetical protein